MIDWAAKWFEIRAEMGQSDQVTFMYQDREPDWVKIHFHHRNTDGFGMMQTVLQEEGLPVRAPIRPLKKPAWFLQPFLLIKGIRLHPKLDQNPWKFYDPTRPSAQPDDVSAWFLSKSETQALAQKAKDQNLNVGFYILSEVDQLLRKKLFQDPDTFSTWLCPVDVRGAFKSPSLKRNWVSFIITCFKGPSSQLITQQAFTEYKQSLKTGTYWAFWELYQIGKYIGLKGMKRLAEKAQNKSFWMGSFSDLGTWNQEALKDSKAQNRRWVMAPPGSPSYPIGVTTIEWCEQRTITLKIHPAIVKGDHVDLAHEIIGELRKRLL